MGDTVESLDTIFIQFDLVSYQTQTLVQSDSFWDAWGQMRSDQVQKWQKIFFLILKIWLITIEGIRSDTLDLTQVRIVVSRIKFFQTQKHDHIRPAIPPEVAPETGIRRPSGPVRNDPIHGPVRLVYLFALSSHRILIFSWPGPDRSVLVHPWPEVNRKLRFWNCMNQ